MVRDVAKNMQRSELTYLGELSDQERKELSELLKEHRRLNVKLCKLLRDWPLQRMDFEINIPVKYEPEFPRRLDISIPMTPPTVKTLSYINDCGSDGIKEYKIFRNTWLNYIRYALDVAERKGLLEGFYPFEKAFTFIRLMEPDARLRDADNYVVTIVHNALVRNRVLLDDNLSCLRWWSVGVENSTGVRRTNITVIEDFRGYMPDNNCHNCQFWKAFYG